MPPFTLCAHILLQTLITVALVTTFLFNNQSQAPVLSSTKLIQL